MAHRPRRKSGRTREQGGTMKAIRLTTVILVIVVILAAATVSAAYLR
jgi:hypothetical protein